MSKALQGKVDLDQSRSALNQLGMDFAAEALTEHITQAVKDNVAPHVFLDRLLSFLAPSPINHRHDGAVYIDPHPPGVHVVHPQFTQILRSKPLSPRRRRFP